MGNKPILEGFKVNDLEENFRTLLYDLGECNWRILTPEAWDKYINRHEPFTEKQIQDIKDFLVRLQCSKDI